MTAAAEIIPYKGIWGAPQSTYSPGLCGTKTELSARRMLRAACFCRSSFRPTTAPDPRENRSDSARSARWGMLTAGILRKSAVYVVKRQRERFGAFGYREDVNVIRHQAIS